MAHYPWRVEVNFGETEIKRSSEDDVSIAVPLTESDRRKIAVLNVAAVGITGENIDVPGIGRIVLNVDGSVHRYRLTAD